jgi:hypothetical protein
MDAAGAVDAQTAPTAPWKTPERVFHKRPQAIPLQGDISISLKEGTFLFRYDRLLTSS